MKVCLINNLYPPYSRGGAEHVVFSTVQGLLARGDEVVVITTAPQASGLTEEAKLKIYRFQPRNVFFYTQARKHNWLARWLWHIIDMFHFGAARYVKKILEAEKPDIVHTHNLMGMSFLIPGVIRRLGLRHLHTVHDVQLVEPSGIILKLREKSWRYNNFPTFVYSYIMKKLLGCPDVVISPSQFLLDFYAAHNFFAKSKKVMLRNPVARRADDIGPERHPYNHIRFLYLGQIEEHKGVVFLVDAFRRLVRRAGLNAELNIVGDGSKFKPLKLLTANETRIILRGKVDRVELPKLFEDTDITVVPSLCYENSPTVIFESFSFGVPVLASRVEGIAELIREGENGLTFETGNAGDLEEKLLWCVNNIYKVVEMGGKTGNFLKGLSTADYINKLGELYEK